MHYAVNHLGHFYLTYLIMNKLQKSDFFKIINVSSLAHKKVLGFMFSFDLDFDDINFAKQNSYNKDLAYSRSKLYNVLFTKALAQKIDKSKGIALCLHPGVVRT
jgi:NAD(P)-dependent dehydrogenase (short-subunit alcohol dehydrogenase family)